MKNFRWSALALAIAVTTANAQIIFETDFRNDGDYYITDQILATYDNVPTGFDGALVEGDGYIEGQPGEGMNGGVALYFLWDPDLGQPVTQLMKHLTGDRSTGYDEVYVRYRLRLPDNFKVGKSDVDDVPYWKFGRLWQNTGMRGSGWTENRSDSYYAVWNFGGTDTYGIDAGGTFGANSGNDLDQGSAGGARYSNDFYRGRRDFSRTDGHFRAVGDGSWDFDSGSRMLKKRPQEWHTIEWRFKLSSRPGENDGRFQMWFDGEEQLPVEISGKNGAPSVAGASPSTIPTAVQGSGYNLLVVFDNMATWNKDWDKPGVKGGIYINDIVVSRSRIGHEYMVDGDLPAPPDAPIVLEP